MANMDHVQLVKRGRDVVAQWREEHPNETLDLNASYLSYARLPQVNLSGADIRNSDLIGAMLQRANLSGCHLNPSHLYHANLKQADLSRALLNGANLRGANLSGADLSHADLDRAILSGADLSGANLTGANLSRTNLTSANLDGADLAGAALNGAAITRTDLTNVSLKGADFYEAVLNRPVLTGANFDGSIVGYTIFQDCDFSGAQGLDHVRHDAPSTIGIDSLYRSGGGISEGFLRASGVHESLIELQQSLTRDIGPLEDCFISCTQADRPFAEALQTDLKARGLRCWVFSDDVRGNPLVERHSTSDQEEIERGVREYDRLIVLCSQAALESETVRNDIAGAKDLQQKQDKWILYLVALDDAVVSPRGRGLARDLSSEHVVFDLRGRDSDSEGYQSELAKLLEALSQSQPVSAGVPVLEVRC